MRLKEGEGKVKNFGAVLAGDFLPQSGTWPPSMGTDYMDGWIIAPWSMPTSRTSPVALV